MAMENVRDGEVQFVGRRSALVQSSKIPIQTTTTKILPEMPGALGRTAKYCGINPDSELTLTEIKCDISNQREKPFLNVQLSPFTPTNSWWTHITSLKFNAVNTPKLNRLP